RLRRDRRAAERGLGRGREPSARAEGAAGLAAPRVRPIGERGREVTETTSAAGTTNEGALWGARFAGGPAPELAELSRSTHFDWILAPYDIAGSHAHATALEAAGYLEADEAARMHAGLDALAARIADGTLLPDPGDEDVHGALEKALI